MKTVCLIIFLQMAANSFSQEKPAVYKVDERYESYKKGSPYTDFLF